MTDGKSQAATHRTFSWQRGMILFSGGGQHFVLAKKQIHDIDSTVCLGDGAMCLLGLLRTEADCPPEVHWTPANVEWITKTVLRERELFSLMAGRRYEAHAEFCPSASEGRKSLAHVSTNAFLKYWVTFHSNQHSF